MGSVVTIPLYPLWVIMFSIATAVYTLRETVAFRYKEYGVKRVQKETKEIKLVEIIGECIL